MPHAGLLDLPYDVLKHVISFTGLASLGTLSRCSSALYQFSQEQQLWKSFSVTRYGLLNDNVYGSDYRALYKDRNGWFPKRDRASSFREQLALNPIGTGLSVKGWEPNIPFFNGFVWDEPAGEVTDIYLSPNLILTSTSTLAKRRGGLAGCRTLGSTVLPIQISPFLSRFSYSLLHSYKPWSPEAYGVGGSDQPPDHNRGFPLRASSRFGNRIQRNVQSASSATISVRDAQSLELVQTFFFNTSAINCLTGPDQNSNNWSLPFALFGDNEGRIALLRSRVDPRDLTHFGKVVVLDPTTTAPHQRTSQEAVRSLTLTSQDSVVALHSSLGETTCLKVLDLQLNGRPQNILLPTDLNGFSLDTIALSEPKSLTEVYGVGHDDTRRRSILCLDFRTPRKVQRSFCRVPFGMWPLQLWNNGIFVNYINDAWNRQGSFVQRFDRRWTATTTTTDRELMYANQTFYSSQNFQLRDFCCLHDHIYAYGYDNQNNAVTLQRWPITPEPTNRQTLVLLPQLDDVTSKLLSIEFPYRSSFRCNERTLKQDNRSLRFSCVASLTGGWSGTLGSSVIRGCIGKP